MQTALILTIICGVLARICYFAANDTRSLFVGTAALLMMIVFLIGAAICAGYAAGAWLLALFYP